jgi:hypothetical protein
MEVRFRKHGRLIGQQQDLQKSSFAGEVKLNILCYYATLTFAFYFLNENTKNIQTRSNVAFTRILTIQSTVIINVKYNFFIYSRAKRKDYIFSVEGISNQ